MTPSVVQRPSYNLCPRCLTCFILVPALPQLCSSTSALLPETAQGYHWWLHAKASSFLASFLPQKGLCAFSAPCTACPTRGPFTPPATLSSQGNGGGSCRTTGYQGPDFNSGLQTANPAPQKVQRFQSQNPHPFGMSLTTPPGLGQATRMHDERGHPSGIPCPRRLPPPATRKSWSRSLPWRFRHPTDAQSLGLAAVGLQDYRGRCGCRAALAGKRAGRPPPWWCAVQHFSNRRRRPRGDGGRGAAGAAELPCQAEPSRGGGPEAAQTSGARGPGSSARRSATISREVRAPGGAGAFPRGAGAGWNPGPPQTGRGPRSTDPRAEGRGWGTVSVFGRGCEAPGKQR